MVLVVELAEALPGHVGVDLGGRDVGVAEHHLQGAQVGAPLQEMAREGVAQHVRGQDARPPRR